jgi:hypothetical protein
MACDHNWYEIQYVQGLLSSCFVKELLPVWEGLKCFAVTSGNK